MQYLSNTGFRKISFGFLVIIAIALLNVVISSLVISKNKRTATTITNEINPYVETLEAFNQLIIESKMYSTNWVYLPNNVADKDSLKKIHAVRYPQVRSKLTDHLDKLNRGEEKDSLESIFKAYESVVSEQKKIMTALVEFEDYENPLTKFSAEEIIESSILPGVSSIQNRLKSVISRNRAQADVMKDEMLSSFRTLMVVLLVTSTVLFLIVLIASGYITRAIKRPILAMREMILKMGKGELPETKLDAGEGVVGEMGAAVNTLTDSFSRSSVFANQIGRGNLSAKFHTMGERDMLGNALINMRDSLRIYSENLEQKVAERTKEVIEKSAKLEIALDQIRESINYAKHIQEAILPAFDFIRSTFPDSFILYRPKDIVCGDFYWYTKKGDEAVIAAVDCTGHGVPGALMTVIGNSLLNQIVNLATTISPSEILTLLDKKLLETLQQHGGLTTNDGMDIALCKYNLKTGQLVFAGAKRPMYLFRNGELRVIKGDKYPIGSFQYEDQKVFTEYSMTVKKGDLVYLFSDGYQDQFGGKQGKKFMVSKLKETLTNISSMSMDKQLDVLDRTATEWQGTYEQTDDILVIGVRF